MSLSTRIVALAQAIGTDIKTLTQAQGSLSALSTTNKESLVEAINELDTARSNLAQAVNTLFTMVGGSTQIDDNAGDGDTAVTWSADKIFDAIETAKSAVKNDLVNGAGAALDTLNELAAALNNDPSFATTIAGEIANRVRYDAAQTLSAPQQAQARANIAAAAASDMSTLLSGLGAYDSDYVATYNTAKSEAAS